MNPVSEAGLRHFEKLYPGIRAAIRRIDGAPRPLCPHCQSADTAHVYAGLVVRALAIASATARLHVMPHASRARRYWCHACQRVFGAGHAVGHEWLGVPAPAAGRASGINAVEPPAAG